MVEDCSGTTGRDRIAADQGRRELLRKAAVGGALVWTAPALLSSPAFAQGSTPPTTLPPPPQPVLDVNNTGTAAQTGTSVYNDASLGTGHVYSEMLQAFVAGRTGSIVQLHVYLNSRAADTGALVFTIYAADGGGNPTGPALGSGQVNAPALGWAEHVVTITPAPVTTGSTYAVVATPQNKSLWQVGSVPSTLLNGFGLRFRFDGVSWGSPSSGSMWLQTYVLL